MTPFLGEIRAFGFTFAPKDWISCDGQTLSIQQYSALYSLLGTSYGGDGTRTFQLPNLNGRAPLHAGQGPGLSPYTRGEVAGVAAVALIPGTLPSHNHGLNAQNADANNPGPGHGLLAKGGKGTAHQFDPYLTYASGTPNQALAPASVAPVGGNFPHDNTQPSLALNFCIALAGVFPPHS